MLCVSCPQHSGQEGMEAAFLGLVGAAPFWKGRASFEQLEQGHEVTRETLGTMWLWEKTILT